MALDPSFTFARSQTKSALPDSGDQFSVLPSSYGDALGDAAAGLEAVMARLAAVDAQLRGPAQGSAARETARQELLALRDRLLSLAEACRAARAELPRLAQLEDALRATACEGHERLQEDLEQLAAAGQQLHALQAQAASQQSRHGQESSHAALRRAAQQLGIEHNATALRAHGDGADDEPSGALRSAADLGLSAAQEKAVRHMSQRVRGAVRGAAALPLGSAEQQALGSGYGQMLGQMQTVGGAEVGTLDTEALIQRVLHDAYKASSDDMRGYALRVDFYSQLRGSLRDELQKARKFASDNASADELAVPYPRQRFSTLALVGPNGQLKARPGQPDGDCLTAKQLDDYLKELENQLNTVGEDNQLAQLKLQQMVQRQQQMLQTLSNLAKVFHETHMSIIRKLGQ